MEKSQALESLDELRAYVHRTLCERENLVEEQFAMRESSLVMYGAACGLQFMIHGPRSTRLSAVWAADPNVVYFYDASGERFLKVRLNERFAWGAPVAA